MRLIKCFCVNAGHRHTPDIMMLVHWRECDWDRLWEAMREQLGMRRHLVAYSWLRFFDFPLMQSYDFVLQYLIAMWTTDLQCFNVRGKQLTFSVIEDAYLFMELPLHGMALPIDPSLLGDE